jgi:transcriptional regulator with XRE-family HTH domain
MTNRGAERLVAYRDKHKLKQYEIAELLEIDDAHISQLLSGRRRPGLPLAVRIEDRTGIPAESWLLPAIGESGKADADSNETAVIGKEKTDGPNS